MREPMTKISFYCNGWIYFDLFDILENYSEIHDQILAESMRWSNFNGLIEEPTQ